MAEDQMTSLKGFAPAPRPRYISIASTKRMAADVRTLLLNSTYEPLKVISWQRAVTLMWLGKVEVIRTYERDLRAVTFKIRMPAVVRLLRFIRRKRPQVSFSRRNLFARDANSCQYCGGRRDSSELTYDHVIPRSQGGKTDWTNIVDLLRGLQPAQGEDALQEQAGMRLLRTPKRPDKLPGVLTITVGIQSAPGCLAGLPVLECSAGRRLTTRRNSRGHGRLASLLSLMIGIGACAGNREATVVPQTAASPDSARVRACAAYQDAVAGTLGRIERAEDEFADRLTSDRTTSAQAGRVFADALRGRIGRPHFHHT